MALTITIEITDEQEACLNHNLLNIEDWVQQAMDGKVENCKKRLIQEWQPRLLADPDVETLAGNEAGLIAQIIAHPLYKNRRERDG